MAAAGVACPFPVLVQAGWGCPEEPPKSVRSKLLCYFQSRKKSGGGECEIQRRSEGVLVCFAAEEARQRVLAKKTHELHLANGEKLKLVVTLQETTIATKQNVSKEQGVAGQAPEQEDQQKKMDVQETFQDENITVQSSSAGEIPQPNLQAPSLVALENVPESIDHDILSLLVESIVSLSAKTDFQVELIREKEVAVITFQQNTDAANFLDKCAKNRRFKEFKMTARPLELTKMIKVEKIPPDARKDYIALYFESPVYGGGGQVSDIQILPEESAIITFCDNEAVQTTLEKQHSFYQQPILVYPYFSSLDIVLYGEDRPRIKMPEQFSISLYPPIWQFLQAQKRLLLEIDLEMSSSYCELTWPLINCEHPEVTMHPSVALAKQGTLKLIKDWKDKASSEFACILSKFKAAECKIIPEAWETIKNTLIKDDVLAIPNVSKETVVLAGFAFSVDDMENQIKGHVDKFTKDAEKAKQTIQERWSVAPGKYAVLNSLLLEKNIYKLNPGLRFSYDASVKQMQLHGMPAEVYKMKSDLLEKLHAMMEKKVDAHPHILQFLQHADSKKVSVAIFGANKINAAYELTHESIALLACSPEDLLKAEEHMKKGLDHKCITLENQEVIKKKEWKELTQQLQKKHNSSVEDSVIIDDCLVLGEVSIAGYAKTVADVFQKLSDFVSRNTQVQKVIAAKSIAVVQYLKEKNINMWQDFRKRGLNIEFGSLTTCKNIILSGPKVEVLKAATDVELMLSFVHSFNVPFDKPGVKAFFKNREKAYIIEAKQTYDCLIRLQEDAEDNGDTNERIGHPCAEIKLKDGVVVGVHKGDLTNFQVDVVVNASNEDLKHIGGLADALLKVAGPQLQRECDDLIRKHGSLKPGCAIITNAWNLPCKQVIHAVGPRWNSSEKEKCTLLLKKAVRESLKLAETYNHCSIAIPAVSSGIFGFPLNACAHSIVTAIKEALEESTESGSLKRICLVDVADNTVQALTDALNKVFRGELEQPRFPDLSQMVKHSKDIREDLQIVTSPEGLKLILQHKGIEDATTDVVVSTIGADLKLGVGPLSQALLLKAGPMLKAEFDQTIQGLGVQDGSVVQTRGHGLPCSSVFHAVLHSWDGGQGNAMKTLREVMRKCLEETEELSFSSISFPAIGAGGFSFPAAEVAKAMFEEVLQFSSQKNLKSLQEVHFILHPKNKKNIEAFSEVFESMTGGGPKAAPLNDEQNAGFFGPISTPNLGVHEMQIGSVKFQVLTGDITKENTDVIVNVTNNTFDAKSGVSKAILEGGGPQVQMECANLASQPHSGYITTQGGNLLCKKIIHLAPNPDIKGQISQALQECELKKHTSVAFPAIGTGQAKKAPENVADEIIDAVADFVGKAPPQHLKMIKIVIFQTHMQNAFYATMKKREGAALPTSKSVLSWFKTLITRKKPPKKKRLLVLEKKTEVAVFEICGKTKKSVEDAVKWLKDLILGEQIEKRFQDVVIETFDEAEIQKLNDLQRRLHITIHLEKEKSPPLILVSGILRHVMDAHTEIQALIDTMKHDQEEKSKAQLVENLVEWRYQSNGDIFLAFDVITNLHLEDGKINNKTHVNIQLQGKNYRVNLKKMHATDDQKRCIEIQRVSKDKLYMGLPAEWEDMKGSHVKLVSLQPASQEYKDVDAQFKRTCPSFKIETIERVQNPFLWQSFQVLKQAVNKKNGHEKNEKILFHGTPNSTAKSINQTGFNRSYAGKNAAAIGKGTYFAVQASYSANDTYAVPDPNGRKYMYLARVLTGDYCVGTPGQITPPPKTPGGVDLYDSVADCTNNPSMFVIFRDAQAYPEYLITFRR